MGCHLEYEVVWVRDKKAPVIKLNDLDFDILTVKVRGDQKATFRFTAEEAKRFLKEHHKPHHYTFKMDPNLLQIFKLK